MKMTTQLLIDMGLARFYYTELQPERRPDWKPPKYCFEDCLPYWKVIDEFNALVVEFERDIWFENCESGEAGLQQIVNDCRTGQKAEGNGYTLLIMCCAGRGMLTFSNEAGEDVTLITADDEEPFQRRPVGSEKWGPMGIQSMNGDHENLFQMIRAFMNDWKNYHVAILPYEHVSIV
jgi:hypothetical protein